MNEGQRQAAAQYASICRMLADLDAAEDIADEDDARQRKVVQLHTQFSRIADHPLSVMVRSDWTQPGDSLDAAEFQILLCTGGPAVRIIGDLDQGVPCSARMEYRTWGTDWIQHFGALPAVLCDYASHFFFGD